MGSLRYALVLVVCLPLFNFVADLVFSQSSGDPFDHSSAVQVDEFSARADVSPLARDTFLRDPSLRTSRRLVSDAEGFEAPVLDDPG